MNDGSYLPVFMPLLLAIVGLRPLPNYFVHACDYVDLKVVKEGGKAGSKPLTELLLQEYGSDLQGSLGVDYVLRMLDAFNVKTGYFPNSQVIAWIVPKSLRAKLPRVSAPTMSWQPWLASPTTSLHRLAVHQYHAHQWSRHLSRPSTFCAHLQTPMTSMVLPSQLDWCAMGRRFGPQCKRR
jgi:hypothetical protein